MNRSERRKQKRESYRYHGILRHKTYNPNFDCESSITEKDLIKINNELFVRCPVCGYEIPAKYIVEWNENR